jgi:hypothetical protein
MVDRVMHRYASEIVSAGDLLMLRRELTRAIALRDRLLPNDHDIDLLHPARTVLILLDDVRISAPEILAAAALLESERPDLRVVLETAARDSGEPPTPRDLADIVAGIPTPLDGRADAGAESSSLNADRTADLLERLVALPEDRLMMALAERLDHARHLHLRPRTLWARRVHLEEMVYLPLAERVGGLLGARYNRWYRSFERRRGPDAGGPVIPADAGGPVIP